MRLKRSNTQGHATKRSCNASLQRFVESTSEACECKFHRASGPYFTATISGGKWGDEACETHRHLRPCASLTLVASSRSMCPPNAPNHVGSALGGDGNCTSLAISRFPSCSILRHHRNEPVHPSTMNKTIAARGDTGTASMKTVSIMFLSM